MSNTSAQNPEDSNGSEGEFREGPAAEVPVSLSQAILGPLDAIFKSQVHAARSFLNFVQQLGYPHVPESSKDETASARPPDEASANAGGDENGGGNDDGNNGAEDGSGEGEHDGTEASRKSAYTIDFLNEVVVDGERQLQKISVPALALVPVAPLAVENAKYAFDLYVRHIKRHKQMRQNSGLSEEERKNRPWMLVDEPISVRGHFAPPEQGGEAETARQSRVQVEIEVGRVPHPAALDKLLTTLGQISSMEHLPPDAGPAPAPGEDDRGEREPGDSEDDRSESDTS